MKKGYLIILLLLINTIGFNQVSKTNSISGTVTAVPSTGAHIDRTFAFSAGDFGGCSSLTEVEISIQLLLGNGTPPTLGAYGVHEDLNVRLVSPLGTTVDLVQDRWGYWTGNSSQTHTFNGFTAVDGTVNFDDDHPNSIIPLGTVPEWVSGNFSPHNPLSTFDGENPAGTWTLRISDGNNQFAASDYVHFVTATLTVTCGAACTDPDVPNLSATAGDICPSGSKTINISGNLNDATQWTVYSGSCGGTLVGTSVTSSFVVNPSTTTKYFIRGEGGCVTPGLCDSITVYVDTTPPTAICQNITVFLNGAGSAVVFPGDINAGSTDNCGIGGTSSSPAVFNCSNIGPNNVTLTVNDVNGNSSTCVSTVTIADTNKPTAVCQNITVFLDGSGNATITGGDIDGGSSDNCGIASLSASPSSFTCANIGANSVTLTVTDLGGNSTTCVATVTVQDTNSPTAVCQNVTVFLDGSGNASITAGDVDGGSTDNCSIAGLSVSPSSFTCADVGSNTVTLTVTDANGNSSNCSGTVTVQDTTSPTAVCQNVTVFLDGTGNATITGPDLDGGSLDNCGVANSYATPNTFNCTNIGANTVTLTVEDAQGNSRNCIATVDVQDTTSPTAVCQNISVYLDGSGNATITAGDVDGGSTDNCGISSMSLSQSSFTCSNVGANVVTLTVSDANGNSSSCAAMVTVIDTTSPTAVCQNVTVFLDGAGNASITAGDIDGGSTDNCSLSGLSVSPSSFTCSNVGANTVTLTVSDVNGNSSTCSAIVTVVDTTSPTAVCQNITVYLDGTGSATITGTDIDNGSTDNCGISSRSLSQSSFTCTNIGANTVTLTVTDGSGNSSTCAATVTVADTTSPTAVCQNISVYLDGSGNATITAGDLDGGSTDNCGISSMSLSQSSFTCSNVGANVVTLTVSDANGNSSSCAAMVTVIDTTSPTAVCQNVTVFLDGAGNATITAGDIDGGSTDNCSLSGLSVSPSSFTCSNVGANTVTLTVSDVNGNSSTCSAIVTVVDTTSPTAVCQNITVYLDGTGSATITGTDIDNGSTDNCGISSRSLSQSSFTCSNIGANTVTLTVSDANGNSSTCAATVTVADTTAPTAVCQNISVYLDGSGNATITAGDVDGGSTDNCGISSMSLSQSSFTCSDVGANVVTLTVSDANGNSSSCAAMVTVIDTTSPTAVCQNVTVFLDGAGNATITAGDIDGGSTDNCSLSGLSVSPSSFTCSNVGANTVTLTVSDVNGNSSTCSAIVTVVDTIAPTMVCQNISLYIASNGKSALNASDIDGGTTDNCGVAGLTVSKNLFTCSDIGTNSVTLYAIDFNGNIDSCIAIVTVIDTITRNAGIVIDSNVSCVGSFDGGLSVTYTLGTMPYSYLWSDLSITPSITGLDTGVYWVSIIDSAGCEATDTISLTANSILQDTLLLINVCQNDSVLIFGNYESSAGWYYDTLTSLGGCDSIIYQELNVLLLPTSTTTDTICKGDSVNIGGVWYSSGIINDTIFGAGSNGCDSIVTHTIRVDSVSPSLDLGSDVLACSNDIITLYAAPGYGSYLWNTSATTSNLTINGPTYGVGQHDFWLTVTDTTNGCSETDTVQVDLIQCVGINDIDNLTYNIYPNPSTGFLTVLFNEKLNNSKAEINVINSLGQVIYAKNIIGLNKEFIDLSNHENGIYNVVIKFENKLINTKLILNK